MGLVMPKVKGRADGKRVSAASGRALALVRTQLELPNEVAAELAGPGDAIMKTLEEHLDCEVFLRGNVLTLDGADEDVAMGRTVVRELADLVEQGHEIAPGTIEAITDALDRRESPSRILEDVVWRHRSMHVAPKTVNQKRYVDSIRHNTITVGIGPAGTGKSFLAVAMAVAALSRREVNRIVLTRPAVEAGERLGFLPGDIMAKVDPYLRPLFDALYDMLEPERVNQHLERGVIEIAPLAFMRGRAQPVDQQVLTPDGFRRRSARCASGISSSARTARPTRSSACIRRAASPSSASARRTAPRRSAAASTSGAFRRWTTRSTGRPAACSRPGRWSGNLRGGITSTATSFRSCSAPVEFEPRERADRSLRARAAPRRRLPDHHDHAELHDRRRELVAALETASTDRAAAQGRGRLRPEVPRRRRGGVIVQPGHRAAAGTRAGRHPLRTKFVPRTTSSTRPTSAWRSSKACSTPTAGR